MRIKQEDSSPISLRDGIKGITDKEREALENIQGGDVFEETVKNGWEQFSTENRIEKYLEDLKKLLIYKNTKYNDSLQRSTGYFSNLTPVEKIKSRIDDKLNRIIKSEELQANDLLDLQGYLVHLAIAMELDYKDLQDYYD